MIRIYNRKGVPLVDIKAKALRSWALNDIGSCSFEVSTKDPNSTEANLQIGNIVVVDHPKLPPWIGFIDSSQQMTFDYGKIAISCVSGESIFKWRTEKIYQISGTGAGIIKKLIEKANKEGSPKISFGDITDTGRNFHMGVHSDLFTALNKIYDVVGNDWRVTPGFDDHGLLQLRFNYYDGELGTETGIELNNKNTEMLSPAMVLQGDIYNDVRFYGESPIDEERTVHAFVRDEESINKYGLRQYLNMSYDATKININKAADVFLYEHKEPARSLAIAAVDVNDLFYNMDIGNYYTFNSKSIGYYGGGTTEMVRVIGMEYDDADPSVVGCVIDVIREDVIYRAIKKDPKKMERIVGE